MGVCLLVVVAACGGSETGNTGGSGGGTGGNTGGTGTGGATGGTGTGGSTGGTGPSCSALADAVRVSHVTASSPALSNRAITAQRGEGSVVAWAASDGKVHAQPLDANDAPAGAEISVEGTQVFGVAASDGEVALLVSRAPDFMTFTRLGPSGETLSTLDLVGGGDHATVGVEWFGEFAQTGRLAARDGGGFAAYHALHRRWPDNIGHQGDTLRLLDKDGAAEGGGWDWGCSHSMDQRLASGPNGLVPICIADCYPGKGIYFNHSAAEITSDPGANCAGGYFTQLGGLVATADGFFLVFQDAQGMGHLGHFDAQGGPISDRVLGGLGSSRLARYEDGLLIGVAGNVMMGLEKLDAAGEPIGEQGVVAVDLPDEDFESRSDGSVAWATAKGADITVVRVQACP